MLDERQLTNLRRWEGRRVSIALVDGSRIDDCQLISACRRIRAALWIYDGRRDVFLPLRTVVDIWESGPNGYRAA